jgi:hypothetical protein
MAPALLGRLAAAGVVLTGKGNGAILHGMSRDRDAERSRQMAYEHEAHQQAADNAPDQNSPSAPRDHCKWRGEKDGNSLAEC